MKELIFIIEEADEGGYIAKALGESIYTEADDVDTLKSNIIEAVHCHFDDDKMPKVLRLHFIQEEILAA